VEDHSEMSSSVKMLLKQGRLGESDIRSQNEQTICSVYKFFKDIFEQFEHFLMSINVHKTQ
jgi:hypothetical protein